MTRVPAIGFAVLVAVAAAGCTDPNLLSGQYVGSQALQLPGSPGMDPLFLTLDLRHFGPEVGGTVLFSKERDQFVPSKGGCSCRYVVGGVTKTQEAAVGQSSEYAFTFRFRVPQWPCDTDGGNEVDFIAVSLVSDDTGETLTGKLKLENEELGTGDWVFTREKDAGDLPGQVDECEDDQARP